MLFQRYSIKPYSLAVDFEHSSAKARI